MDNKFTLIDSYTSNIILFYKDLEKKKIIQSAEKKFFFFFKGIDRQSEVVELSMQYCAQIL